MCCITGVITDGTILSDLKQDVRQALQKMSHRGPDDTNIITLNEVVLGHCRLSIVDPRGGHQPLFNENRTIFAVVNGEIYNYPELRELLEKKGHFFKTNSDSEVVIHLYEEFGPEFVGHLDGMFAFGLWDSVNKRFIAARDPIGQKPFYYFFGKNRLFFSSELKGLLAYRDVPRSICIDSVAHYMLLNYVPAPYTILKDLKKLEPGHILIYDLNKGVTTKSYYEIPINSPPYKGSINQAEEEFWYLMDRSVKKRLLSDVPIGIFVSGGIDSSIILSSMVKLIGNKRINAYSIGFNESSFDESGFAKEVADYFGVNLNLRVIQVHDIFEIFKQLGELFDEPVSDNSLIPTYMLARFAAEDVKTVLSGDGGDELFFGYPTFQAEFITQLLNKIPLANTMTKMSGSMFLKLLGVDLSNISLDFKIRRFLRGINLQPHHRHAAYLGALTPDLVREAFLNQDIVPAYNIVDSFFPADTNTMKALSAFYLRTYLGEDVLVKVDRATMAASLEARAPFLDKSIIEFAFSLPTKFVFSPFTTKPFLRRVLRQRLKDKSLLKRPKKGFGMPVGPWFKGPLRGLLLDVLSEENIQKWGIFDYSFINRLIVEHLQGRADHRMPLFSLLLIIEWLYAQLN